MHESGFGCLDTTRKAVVTLNKPYMKRISWIPCHRILCTDRYKWAGPSGCPYVHIPFLLYGML